MMSDDAARQAKLDEDELKAKLADRERTFKELRKLQTRSAIDMFPFPDAQQATKGGRMVRGKDTATVSDSTSGKVQKLGGDIVLADDPDAGVGDGVEGDDRVNMGEFVRGKRPPAQVY